MYVKNAIIHLVDKSMDGALLNNVELPVSNAPSILLSTK